MGSKLYRQVFVIEVAFENKEHAKEQKSETLFYWVSSYATMAVCVAIYATLHLPPTPTPTPNTGLRGITKTRLYNFDPLKPHFYIVKLELTGYTFIFYISAQKHRLWVLVRTASACDTHTHMNCYVCMHLYAYVTHVLRICMCDICALTELMSIRTILGFQATHPQVLLQVYNRG